MSQNLNNNQPQKAADTNKQPAQQLTQKPRRNKAKEWLISLLITLVVLAFTSKKSRAPKAEGIPYDKGAR